MLSLVVLLIAKIVSEWVYALKDRYCKKRDSTRNVSQVASV